MGTHKKEENIVWWVVKTKPQQEFKAEMNLIQQGYTTFCPIFNKELKRGNQFIVKPQPLFAGYLFIQANDFAQKKIYLIRSTKGINSLLKVNETPLYVPHEIIHHLLLNQTQNHSHVTPHFTAGCSVKIISGIYNGIEAIYQMDNGANRSIVLLSLIQKQTNLNLRKQDLIKI